MFGLGSYWTRMVVGVPLEVASMTIQVLRHSALILTRAPVLVLSWSPPSQCIGQSTRRSRSPPTGSPG